MIRLGIVGCNYGVAVQFPAFRLDPRCQVAALAGSDHARTSEYTRRAGVVDAFGAWEEMIERAQIDAVAIAAPPRLQPAIAIAALRRGKPLFIEKPMAADLEGAAAILRAAGTQVCMMDFNFTEIMAWRKAKAVLDAGAVGTLRHVVVTWNVENTSTRLRLKNWKTNGDEGGGALGNFASHSLHYLEWFCGPIIGLSARLSGLPDDCSFETNVTLSLRFQSGAVGSYAMSCASYLGSGHKLEFYGEDGMLILENPTSDYVRGFTITHARRPAAVPKLVEIVDDPLDRTFSSESRIPPVSRLAKRFLDAIERCEQTDLDLAVGYRVQCLLDIARRSHATGRWLDIEPEDYP
jgi:predicted dehydrogenase